MAPLRIARIASFNSNFLHADAQFFVLIALLFFRTVGLVLKTHPILPKWLKISAQERSDAFRPLCENKKKLQTTLSSEFYRFSEIVWKAQIYIHWFPLENTTAKWGTSQNNAEFYQTVFKQKWKEELFAGSVLSHNGIAVRKFVSRWKLGACETNCGITQSISKFDQSVDNGRKQFPKKLTGKPSIINFSRALRDNT